MKLLTCSLKNDPSGRLPGLYIQEKNAVLLFRDCGVSCRSIGELTDHPELLPVLSDCAVKAAASPEYDDQLISYDEVIRRSPIPFPRQDVICLGINYAAHAVESARYKKEAFERDRKYAVYFSKRVNEAVPDGGDVLSHRDIMERLDYEAELAVVIGKEASHVSADRAYDYILGYTILNDISAREIQTRHKQWYFGKSLDAFCPIGPWIVTKDEFDNPPVLKIRSYVNDELRQDSDTGMLMFSIAQIIEELSSGMTLLPGTIISTGTPSGVGMGFDPPRFLVPGDVVRCEIEGIGSLTNPIV